MAYQSKLLQSLSTQKISTPNAGISLLSVEPDTEPVIQIDADLRIIEVPEVLQNIAVTGDHLSETIYFNCPRFFDGEDLSNHTCIIRFINAGNEYGEDNVVNMEVNESSLYFGWALDNNATKYSGEVNFTVQFETCDEDGSNVQYQWQTTPATLTILPALDIDSTISDSEINEILFRNLTDRVNALQENVATLQSQISSLSEILEEINTMKNEINYLKENVVYTLSE